MVRKIAFAILALASVLLGINCVGGLRPEIGHYVAVAWAQDSAPAAATQEDSAADTGEFDTKSSPARVAGPWCGSINDTAFGDGTISLQVKQKGTKLSGSWSDTFGLSGKFNGKIKGDSITAILTARRTKCKVAMVGALVAPNEVSGTYSIFGCRQSDGGTFDITSPSC
jgi:hypothetical protein